MRVQENRGGVRKRQTPYKNRHYLLLKTTRTRAVRCWNRITVTMGFRAYEKSISRYPPIKGNRLGMRANADRIERLLRQVNTVIVDTMPFFFKMYKANTRTRKNKQLKISIVKQSGPCLILFFIVL